MAKKKELSKDIQELKELLKTDKGIIGRDKVLKELKSGNLVKIFVASNTPASLIDDLIYYSKLVNVELVNLSQDNEGLGILAKKNFFISVIGVKN